MGASFDCAYARNELYVPFSKLMFSNCISPVLCPTLDRAMTRDAYAGVAEASSVGLSSWNKRKCARWFVPNCSSNPSAVLPSGVIIIPAFAMKMCNLSVFANTSLAHARTLSSEFMSSSTSSSDPGFRASPRVCCAF